MKTFKDIAIEELAKPFDLKCMIEQGGYNVLMTFWAAWGDEFSGDKLAHMFHGLVWGIVLYVLVRLFGNWIVYNLHEKFPALKKHKKSNDQ